MLLYCGVYFGLLIVMVNSLYEWIIIKYDVGVGIVVLLRMFNMVGNKINIDYLVSMFVFDFESIDFWVIRVVVDVICYFVVIFNYVMVMMVI